MVQLLIKLVAAEERAHELIHALRVAMRGVRRVRGCRCAQIYYSGIDDRLVDYVEEWDDAKELREQFGSERFLHLLGLLETAAERPVVEFRIISVMPLRTHIGSHIKLGEYLRNYTSEQYFGVEENHAYGGAATVK